MKVKLIEVENFNEWIKFMKLSGYPGVHSDDSISIFHVSKDGTILFMNGVKHDLPGLVSESLDRSARKYYILKYFEE